MFRVVKRPKPRRADDDYADRKDDEKDDGRDKNVALKDCVGGFGMKLELLLKHIK